jgi:hypothetical protein
VKTSELIQWQWKDYHTFHQSKTNLIIHLVTTPIFIAALFATLYFLVQLKLLLAGLSFLVLVIAFGAQGYGHSLEKNPSIPFASPKQAFQRIFLEQLVTFPRFFFTGGVDKAMKKKNSE